MVCLKTFQRVADATTVEGSARCYLRSRGDGGQQICQYQPVCDEEGPYEYLLPKIKVTIKGEPTTMENLVYKAKCIFANNYDPQTLKRLQKINNDLKRQVNDLFEQDFKPYRQAQKRCNKAHNDLKSASKEQKTELWQKAQQIKDEKNNLKPEQSVWDLYNSLKTDKRIANDNLQLFLNDPARFVNDNLERVIEPRVAATPPKQVSVAKVPTTPRKQIVAQAKSPPPAPRKAARPKVSPPPVVNPWSKNEMPVEAKATDNVAEAKEAAVDLKTAKANPVKAKVNAKVKKPTKQTKVKKPTKQTKVKKHIKKVKSDTEQAKAAEAAVRGKSNKMVELPEGIDSLYAYASHVIDIYKKGYEAGQAVNNPSA